MTDIDATQLPLQSEWTLYIFGTRGEWIESNFKKVATIKNVAELWQLTNPILPQLDDIDEKLLMFVRDGKSVMMEKNQDMKGGHAIKYFLSRKELNVLAPKQYTPESKDTVFQQIFMETIARALGEDNIYNGDTGVGCIEAFSFSLVKDVCRMTIWVNNKFQVADTKLVPNMFPAYPTRVEKLK